MMTVRKIEDVNLNGFNCEAFANLASLMGEAHGLIEQLYWEDDSNGLRSVCYPDSERPLPALDPNGFALIEAHASMVLATAASQAALRALVPRLYMALEPLREVRHEGVLHLGPSQKDSQDSVSEFEGLRALSYAIAPISHLVLDDQKAGCKAG